MWTNLIANAIDAMDGEGTLRLTTRAEPDRLVVEVTDSGPGMPPYVQSRAFEPWFTTKDVGKGTGLGLDISRRIVVDMHHGEISIHSTPRGTTMRVSLPAAAGAEPQQHDAVRERAALDEREIEMHAVGEETPPFADHHGVHVEPVLVDQVHAR